MIYQYYMQLVDVLQGMFQHSHMYTHNDTYTHIHKLLLLPTYMSYI